MSSDENVFEIMPHLNPLSRCQHRCEHIQCVFDVKNYCYETKKALLRVGVSNNFPSQCVYARELYHTFSINRCKESTTYALTRHIKCMYRELPPGFHLNHLQPSYRISDFVSTKCQIDKPERD